MGNPYVSNKARDLGYAGFDSIGGAVAVTPADGANITTAPCKALWIGGAGNIKVDLIDGSTVTFNGVTAGTLLKAIVNKVYATGTTATNILALY